jgi:hypothetical protein
MLVQLPRLIWRSVLERDRGSGVRRNQGQFILPLISYLKADDDETSFSMRVMICPLQGQKSAAKPEQQYSSNNLTTSSFSSINVKYEQFKRVVKLFISKGSVKTSIKRMKCQDLSQWDGSSIVRVVIEEGGDILLVLRFKTFFILRDVLINEGFVWGSGD